MGRVNELGRAIKPNIRAEAFDSFGTAVMKVGAVLVVVAKVVGGLPNAAAAADESFVEAAVLRATWIVVAQVPLAEDSGAVPGGTKAIRHGHFAVSQQAAAPDGVPGPHRVGIASGHQSEERRVGKECRSRWSP